MATEASGGAYGKFRKKLLRRTQTKPYDRPPTSLRSTQLVGGGEREKNGWLSKLVDPASRLITAGAHKLFSSVFRKRLLPPPPPPHDERMETKDVLPEITTEVGSFSTKEQVFKRNDSRRPSENDGVVDLENILKQKTFTRSEIDHLTALLLSRTDDNLVGEEKGSSGPTSSDEKVVHGRHEMLSTLSAFENGAEHVVPTAVSTPVLRSKVLEDVVASPAELAKAYMGSRPTRASPSVLGLQNEIPREDLSAPSKSFFKPKSPVISLIQKPSSEIRASANDFMTPRYRGRSAIYSMARTPYSRPHPTEVYKPLQAAEISSDLHGASSPSHYAMEGQLSGSRRQVPKRRSSVMESDIGFVGPIRRIRQKPNLLHHKILSLPAYAAPHLKHGSGGLRDVTQISSSFNWSSNLHSSSKALADNDKPSTSNGYVPLQSIKTAQKIFQHLDSFASKGKSPEKKFNIVGGSSPGKSTSESLKVFQTIQDNRKENGLVDSSIAHDQVLKASKWPGEDSVQKVVIPPIEVGVEARSRNKALDNLNPWPSVGHQKKKRVFQMSAHEDYLELDDDMHTNGVAPTLMNNGVEGSELAKSSASFDNPSQNAAILAGKPLVSESNLSPSSLGSSKEDSLPDESAAAQKVAGYTLPSGLSATFTSSMSTQAVVSSPLSTVEMKKVAGECEKIDEVTANSSNSPKMVPFLSSPSSSIVESAATKDLKLELPSSATDSANKADGPDKTDKSTLLLGDASKKMDDASSIRDLFSFGALSNGSCNESPNPVTMHVSSPILFPSTSSDLSPVPVSLSSSPSLSISNGNTLFISTPTTSAGAVVNIASTGGISTSGSSSDFSASAPLFSFKSNIQFGSSAIPSTSATVSFAMESVASSGAKSTEIAFGSATNSLFNATPIGTISVGNNISGFSASTLKSASCKAPTLPAAIFSQASSSSVAFTTSTQNISCQSTSSVISNFGFREPASVNASTVADTFTSGFGSASSVLSSASVTAPISSSSNTSNIFGLQPSKPTVPGSMFATSQSTGFPFGLTASGTSAANNTTQYVMGAASSSSPPSNSASLVFGAINSSSSAASTSTSMFGATSSSSAANSALFTFGAPSAASIFSVPSSVVSTPPSSMPFSTQLAFGNSNPQPFGFGLTPPAGNNDRVNMEDSMAEDSVQVSTPAAPAFGQPVAVPSNPFVFNGAAPSAGSPFQFAGHQNQISPQNTPFLPSGSVEFNAGGAGSFSLGSGGVDKANRRIVKVNRKGIRRK